MDEEGIMYLAFCLAVLLIGISLIPSIVKGYIDVLLFLFVLAGIIMIVLLNYADFVIMPMFFSLLRITFQPAEGYKIIKEQNAIVKNVNGLFYSTGYISANLFGYTFKLETEQADEDVKMAAAPDKWERAIMNIGFPIKYHVVAMSLDVQKVRDELEGKRSYEEFQMSRTMQNNNPGNEMTITDIQRKINVIQRKIDRISQGERPVATVMYIETTAIGVSEKASLDALSQQMKGLQIALSSMDVDLSRVAGREMQVLFNFNFSLPTTLEEVAAHFDQQQ